MFGHTHPTRIMISDIKHNELAAVVVLGNVVGVGCAGEPVDRVEADAVTIKHRLKQTAHGSFFGPHLASLRLLVPETAPIARGHFLGEFFRVRPAGAISMPR